jgi:hypothetical protein
MTNEELFDDLKQFIRATVSQQTAQLDQRLDRVEQQIATKDDLAAVERRLNDSLDEVQEAIADTLTHVTDTIDTTLQEHEKRITRLEQQRA